MSSNIARELIIAAHYMGSNSLVWGNAGNASVKNNNATILISESGTMLGSLTLNQVVEAPLDGPAPKIIPRPSKELPMHQAVYRARPDIGCVVHSSPFYSMLIACSHETPSFNLFVESMYYLYDVRIVEYAHPGSTALAEAVEAHASTTNVIFLKNHGVVVYDVSVKETLARLETLEMACRMWVYAKASGISLDVLPHAVVEDFIYNSGYKATLPRGAMT